MENKAFTNILIQMYLSLVLVLFLLCVLYVTRSRLFGRNNSIKEAYSDINFNNQFLINCHFNKISSIPENITSTKKNTFVNEMPNEQFQKLLSSKVIKDFNVPMYNHKNTDNYFQKKCGFYVKLKFEKWIQSISYKLKEFKIVKLNTNELFQPTKDETSRNYLIDFDVLVYRKYKNHGKHMNVKAHISNITSLSSLLFDLNVYSIKVLGIVFEDIINMRYKNNIVGYDSYTESSHL